MIPPYYDNPAQLIARIYVGSSESIKARLISALKENSLPASLSTLADNLDAFDLTVYVYTLLRQPNIQDHLETLARCIFSLANRLLSLKTASRARWQELLTLLPEGATSAKLACLLKKSSPHNTDEIDADFIFDTWKSLSQIFNIASIVEPRTFKKVLFTHEIPSKIDHPVYETKPCLKTLLFVFYMQSAPQSSNVPLEELLDNDMCQQFILEAISKGDDGAKLEELLTTYNEFFIKNDEKWPLFRQLSTQSLEWVNYLLNKQLSSPVKLDPTLCLSLLKNPVNAQSVKLSIILQTLKRAETLELTLISDVFSFQELPKNIQETIIYTEWVFDKITLTYETENLKANYNQHVEKLLNACPAAYLERAKMKCALAVIKALSAYEQCNIATLSQLPSSKKELRLKAASAVTSASLEIVQDLRELITSNKINLELDILLQATSFAGYFTNIKELP